MYSYIIRRLLFSVVTLFAVLTLVFFLVRIVPGDPAQVILGDHATQQALEALRERLGLNQPLYLQYWHFLANALMGDLGVSMVRGTPVLNEILRVMPYTIELTVVSLIIGVLIGVPLGIWAALRRNRMADYTIRVVSLLGLSLPAFVSAILLLLLFSLKVHWFPVISFSGLGFADHIRSLVLPAFSLGLIMAAYVTRVTRSSMLETLGQDYVRTAQAKGLAPGEIIRRHVLRNALIPIVTVVGLFMGVQIGNSILTEIVFNRPGLGKLIVGALNQRDYTMLQGLMIVYTFIVVVVNIMTDITYGIIDPRVKYE